MTQLTKEQQRAKRDAEVAAFAARKGTSVTRQTLGQQISASLQRNAAKIAAARPALAGTVKILDDGKQLSEVAFADAASISNAVLAELSRHATLASTQNTAQPSARYTRRIRIEIEVVIA